MARNRTCAVCGRWFHLDARLAEDCKMAPHSWALQALLVPILHRSCRLGGFGLQTPGEQEYFRTITKLPWSLNYQDKKLIANYAVSSGNPPLDEIKLLIKN